jgi:septum formation protein
MTIFTAAPRCIVLASASPRRREILAGLGFGLVIDPSTIAEPERKRVESASAYVVRAARIKTREVALRHPDGFVVGADTIVIAGERILGKPADEREAREMLRSLSGRWHEVFTGITVIDNSRGRSGSTHCRSRVHMRRLTASDINGYLSTGEYRDKAGAYAIQGYASFFIDRIEGCYFNIVGFPTFTFARLCRRLRRQRLNST